MFERLLTLPLFQGMTLKELSDVLAHVRLDFVKYEAGDDIVYQGDPCRDLVCVISGELKSTFREENGRFLLTEKLPKLTLLEPYNMFGMYPKYSRSYDFATDGVTLSIERRVFINHVLTNSIVKINTMNVICNRYQQTLKTLCSNATTSIEEKIARFVRSYACMPKGEKELTIKMVDLAYYVQETRLNVSRALNAMQEKGLLNLQRGIITIPALEELK